MQTVTPHLAQQDHIQHQKVDGVRKLAVLRTGALGDFLVTLPALHALKAAYPNAELILLGKPWQKSYLCPARTPVDRVIVVPVIKGIRDEAEGVTPAAEIERFFAQMQTEQFDIAVQFQGQGISANPFLQRLGAKLTVGMRAPGAATLDRWISFYYYQSEVIRYLEVAALLGATGQHLEPQLCILDQDIEEARTLVADPRAYAVLHPGAVDRRRRWPAAKFVQVGKALLARGLGVVVTGAGDERDVVGEVVAGLEGAAINAYSRLSLAGLTGLLAMSQIVISNDTGPLHLARAVGAKTVGIYWLPNVINWGPLTRNRHRPVIGMDLACPYCGMRPVEPWPFEPHIPTCAHEVSFVRDVRVADVLQAAAALLEGE